MTYSNTGFSAHPLANSFNLRQQGNFSTVGLGLGRKSSVRLDHDATLPDSRMPSVGEWIMKSNSELEVPNQLGPELGGSRLDTVGLAQKRPELFICLDGTVMDVKSQKVIHDPSKNALAGCWSECRVISPTEASQTPRCNDVSNDVVSIASDGFSAKYWQQQVASQKPMTSEQEKLLADFEAGKLMKLSRLEVVDENCK